MLFNCPLTSRITFFDCSFVNVLKVLLSVKLKAILMLSILFLTGCSMNSQTKSIMATKLYNKANPNAPFNRDEIIIKDTEKECSELKKWCSTIGGLFETKNSPRYKDYYCTCLY